MHGTIYLLESPSGKRYVGQTWDMRRRLNEYRRGKTATQRALHNALAKYGWAAMRFSTIAQGIQTQAELNAAEAAAITAHNTLSPDGYNLTAGGEGGMPSPETRARLSAASRGNKRRLGIPHTPETRARMSATHAGRKRKPRSPETRAKLRAANLGRKHTAESRANMSAQRRGKPKSAEHRAAISAAARGRKHTPETRAKMSAAQRARRGVKIAPLHPAPAGV